MSQIAKLIIEGNQDLHGITMRDFLKGIFNKNESILASELENIQDGKVEARLLTDMTKSEVEAFAKTIEGAIPQKHPILSHKDDVKVSVIPHTGIKDDTLEERLSHADGTNKHKIVRSSELEETVWALQGAGELFLEASKHTKNLLEIQTTSKDMQVEILRYELQFIDESFDKIIEKFGRGEIDCIGIKSVLTRSYVNDKDIIKKLTELYYRILDFPNIDGKKDSVEYNNEKAIRKANIKESITSILNGLPKPKDESVEA
jgi:hypothetical protein